MDNAPHGNPADAHVTAHVQTIGTPQFSRERVQICAGLISELFVRAKARKLTAKIKTKAPIVASIRLPFPSRPP